jgi:hypothetical protein
MWMVEDDMAGRISVGKSRSGALTADITLVFDGKRVFQLQKFFEEEAVKGGEFFRIRWLVLMSEELRLAVEAALDKKARQHKGWNGTDDEQSLSEATKAVATRR